MQPKLIKDKRDLVILIKHTPSGDDHALLSYFKQKNFSIRVTRAPEIASLALPNYCRYQRKCCIVNLLNALDKKIGVHTSRIELTKTHHHNVVLGSVLVISLMSLASHFLGISPAFKIIFFLNLIVDTINYSSRTMQYKPTPLLAWHTRPSSVLASSHTRTR